jgi:hypothetical protein
MYSYRSVRCILLEEWLCHVYALSIGLKLFNIMFNKTASANSNRIVVTEISLGIGILYRG